MIKTTSRVARRGYGWAGTVVKMDIQGDVPDKQFARKAWVTVKWDHLERPMMCGVAELEALPVP